jgi:autotransporter-associated beta strand protein
MLLKSLLTALRRAFIPRLASLTTAGLALFALPALAAETTISFTSNGGSAWSDGIAEDGDGGSANIAGKTIQFYCISDTGGTFLNVPLVHGNSNPHLDSFDALTTYDASVQNNGFKGMAIRTSDGSEIQVNGFYYSDYGAGSSATLTVKGYRDGGEVASTTFVTAIDGGGFYAKTVSLDSSFDNVDEVRIYSASGTGWHGINAIKIDSAVPANTAPSLGNLNGDSVAWAGVGNTVVLDAGSNLTVGDTEFDARNSGNGDWAGASLTVRRVGTAWGQDQFGFDTSGASFTVSGGNLQGGGLTFATFTSSGGLLSVSFTSSGTSATTGLVRDVMRRVTYRNDTPAADAAIRFTLSDGALSTTADVTVTSDLIYVTSQTDTATVDLSDGVSFSEAVAIALADTTGSQTLVFSSSFSGTLTLAGDLAISESLGLDVPGANNLTISGSTITIGSGSTLSLTNNAGSATVTVASALAGAGNLSKAGVGRLALTSTSNSGGFSGGVTVFDGTLFIGSDSAMSSGTLTLNGGTLNNNLSTFTFDNPIVLGPGGGTILVAPAARVLTVSGNISGSGALAKIGGGKLVLSGSNGYSGGTAISGANGLSITDDYDHRVRGRHHQ